MLSSNSARARVESPCSASKCPRPWSAQASLLSSPEARASSRPARNHGPARSTSPASIADRPATTRAPPRTARSTSPSRASSGSSQRSASRWRIPRIQRGSSASAKVRPSAASPVSKRELESRAQVVELEHEAVDPLLLARPARERARVLREAEVVLRVAAADGLSLVALGQPFRCELTHRLQYGKAPVWIGPDEAQLDERREIAVVRRAHVLRRLRGAAAPKDGEPSEQLLLRLAEQVVAPGDRRRQRPLPGRRVSPPGEHR